MRLVMGSSADINQETELLQFWRQHHADEDIVKKLENELKRTQQQQQQLKVHVLPSDVFEEDDSNKSTQSNGGSSTPKIRGSLLALNRQRSLDYSQNSELRSARDTVFTNSNAIKMDTEYTNSDMDMETSEEPISR